MSCILSTGVSLDFPSLFEEGSRGAPFPLAFLGNHFGLAASQEARGRFLRGQEEGRRGNAAQDRGGYSGTHLAPEMKPRSGLFKKLAKVSELMKRISGTPGGSGQVGETVEERLG